MDFDIKTLDQMDRPRLSAYRSNLDFYNGAQWAERSRYRQLVFNYVKIAVDKVTSYLMNELNFACDVIARVSQSCEPKARQPQATRQSQGSAPANRRGVAEAAPGQEMAKQAEDLIYMVYDQNNCSELDYTTEVDTAILGDGCYTVSYTHLTLPTKRIV